MKSIGKNKTQHSVESNAYTACCTIHKDIEYVFIVWWRVQKIFPKNKNLAKYKYIQIYSIYQKKMFWRINQQ